MVQFSRRGLLVGTAAIVAGAAGCAVSPPPRVPTRVPPSPSPAQSSPSPAPSSPSPAPPWVVPAATFAGWLQRRRAPYLIAHRGAGTTVPEHSLPGYQQALAWGAEAMELSVVRSSDGVLYCHHDLTLDRTTTLTGRTADTDAATFDTGRIRIPRLGPRWSGEQMPAIPRLEAALDLVGGRAVLMVEAKDDRAYPAMMELVEQRGLLDQVMVKAYYNSSRIGQAKRAGLPVFGYLGNAAVATPANIDGLAEQLDPATDAIVLPVRDEQGARLSPSVFGHAVATGVPTWAFPSHRRSDVDRLAALGVTGFVTPAIGYLRGTLPTATTDSFVDGALAPGLTTRDPYADACALGWSVPGAVVLAPAGPDGPRYVCLGDLCPVGGADQDYRVDLEVALPAGTMPSADAFVLAFGCLDDSYLAESGSGYQAWIHGDGTAELHVVTTDGSLRPIARGTSAGDPSASVWTRVSIEVAGSVITLSTGARVVLTATDTTWRGGWLHVGRSQGSAPLAVRQVRVGAGR